MGDAWSSARSICAMRLASATINAFWSGRLLPPATGPLVETGRTAPEQLIAEGQCGAVGALVDKTDRQCADMKLGLPVV
jgi:hypothetical protein